MTGRKTGEHTTKEGGKVEEFEGGASEVVLSKFIIGASADDDGERGHVVGFTPNDGEIVFGAPMSLDEVEELAGEMLAYCTQQRGGGSA